jgi:hypothetical protein
VIVIEKEYDLVASRLSLSTMKKSYFLIKVKLFKGGNTVTAKVAVVVVNVIRAVVIQVGTEAVVAVLAVSVRLTEEGFSSVIVGNVYEFEGLVAPRRNY